MADKDPSEKDKESEPKPDDLYNSMSSIVPRREVDLPEENGKSDGENGLGGTFTDRQDYAPKLSDMQVADKRLNPDLGHKHLNVLEMSRTFPDIYNPFFRMLVKDLIRNNPDMRVSEAMAYVNTALSISIDGEGRIDMIHIMGRAVEAESEKNKMTAM